MNTLIQFIESCLRDCKATADRTSRKNAYDRAFGATQYHIMLNLTEFAEVETLWNETYRPQFEELVYGGEV